MFGEVLDFACIVRLNIVELVIQEFLYDFVKGRVTMNEGKNNGNGVLYGSLIKDVKALIYRSQYEAMKKVNAELLKLYWEIGGEIDHQQREQGWGKSVVEILAKELQKEFPGIKGFTARNLWFMR